MPCEFEVIVAGRRGHMHWEKSIRGVLHCFVTHEPLSMDTNRELIEALARAVGVSKSKVEIVHGIADHRKAIKITDHSVTLEQVLKALGVDKEDGE